MIIDVDLPPEIFVRKEETGISMEPASAPVRPAPVRPAPVRPAGGGGGGRRRQVSADRYGACLCPCPSGTCPSEAEAGVADRCRQTGLPVGRQVKKQKNIMSYNRTFQDYLSYYLTFFRFLHKLISYYNDLFY